MEEKFNGSKAGVNGGCATKEEKPRSQYGKKGSKPRKPWNYSKERKSLDLDSVTTNKIEYWNKHADYNNVTKFAWDTILSAPKRFMGLNSLSPDLKGTPMINPAQIMVLNTVYGPGFASNPNEGVNRALAATMAKIRASLSTSSIGFETADLGIFMASTSSIAALIGSLKRALEVFHLWQERNYTMPRGVLNALGFQYDDLLGNYNTYVGRLNSAIDRYNGLFIPDFSDVYDRQYVMSHNIYADEDSELAQYYAFRQYNYYLYDDTKSQATFMPIDYSGDFMTLLAIVESAMDSWAHSSDFYQINGVLHRAFKDAVMQSIPHYEEASDIKPVVDREHLMQIMNCTIVGTGINSASCNITQDPTTQNYIIWKPAISGGSGGRAQTMLRIFEDDPTPEDNMELTRLVTMWTDEVNSQGLWDLEYCGSEIVLSIDISTYNTLQDTAIVTTINSNNLLFNLSESGFTAATIKQRLQQIAAISPFRYIPCLHVVVNTSDTPAAWDYLGFIGDTYNYITYNYNDWVELQRVAYNSIWTSKL